GREVPPGGAPTTVSPASPAPCAIASGIRRHSLRGHPCTAPSGRHSALRCVFPWGPNPGVRCLWFYGLRHGDRHALMRPVGDAPGCPRRGRARAPRASGLRTRTREPRGDHPTAAPTPDHDVAWRPPRQPSQSGACGGHLWGRNRQPPQTGWDRAVRRWRRGGPVLGGCGPRPAIASRCRAPSAPLRCGCGYRSFRWRRRDSCGRCSRRGGAWPRCRRRWRRRRRR
ncbi:MAG: hypothetical protein JWL99_913, partial [Streptomyces oryziradicis]|nr:hypothetical protein [Actinacidiphila oryziradicis]